MDRARVRLVPGLTLAAVGVDSPAELLDPRFRAGGRAVELAAAGLERARLRLPLAGTPDEAGRMRERPAGARGPGTGWVVLRRWRGAPLGALLRARFTRPRSASLAEREWNLLCHLRAHGVGTPDLLAVGARGAGVMARDSFLLARELEGFAPLDEWLARPLDAAARRRGLRSLGATLAACLRSGVAPPDLRAGDLWISLDPAAGDAACAPAPVPGLRANRLPAVVVVSARGARLAERPGRRAIERLFASLDRDLPLAPEAGWRPRARVLSLALRELLPRSERHALWRRLAARRAR